MVAVAARGVFATCVVLTTREYESLPQSNLASLPLAIVFRV